ncbi:MAG: DNA polymerase III subunit alpha [Chloroflexi bacterium]|nr:DNA polymerase III subunit alpha [Chloroflexota bacterium]
MPPFVHLHVHTEMSLLDGLARITDLVAKAKEHEMQALAITDHGTMSGAMHFYEAAKAQGIKPVLGCEIYVAAEGLKARDKNNYHLILLAENEAGYRNLLRLVSTASLEGFYYKPRVDLSLLKEHHKGLIALSACLQGEVTAKLVAGQREGAREAAQRLSRIFGENNFYLELMDHGLPLQREVNPQLISLARETGLPMVATNDVHYVNQDDAYAHEVLLCIQTGTSIDDPKRMRMESDQFYLRSAEEMAALFPDIPEATANTAQIAERCNLEMKFKGFHLPHFQVPAGYTEESYLEERCAAGLVARFGPPTPAIEERLSYELGVINRMGFASYFLVVSDFVAHAKSRGILVGPGRGSAAGSIVSYVLGITTINPLEHDLIFERFLNPDRISMPDVDIDFADDRRDEVIRYVTEKYGSDHVAQIITFGTMAAKAAIRDVGRALGLPYGEVDRVAKLIPFNSSIADALKTSSELRALHDGTDYVQKLLTTSQRLEGVSRHASTHAAGVVISREPLVRHVPLQKATRGEAVTQYPMDVLEKIGLLKMDFLGLSTLTILGRAVEIVNQTEGLSLDLDHTPLDDPAIYELLSRGETVGIFQLEGSFTTRMTLDVKPSCFNDVVALMALIRPGPMTMAPLYIQRKHGQIPIEYRHPDMEPILKETYGVALYQEQIMRIANVLAGYTMSEADALRKAMGKKLPEEMKKHRKRFVSGATKHGLSKGLSEEIFEMIERFAGYGFNKAHSVAYAVIACQTAYFKARYPEAYMTGLLSSEIGNTDKIVTAVSECRRLGIAVLPPDVNRSEVSFTIDRHPQSDKKAIRFGLGAVKNVGEGAIEAIIAGRQNLPQKRFTSLEEFCQRIDLRQVNRRALESLIKCGAMDSLGQGRSQMLESLDQAIALAQEMVKAREAGQLAMFDSLAAAEASPPQRSPEGPGADETSHKVRLAWEKEMLGIYVSEHPLSRMLARIGNNLITTAGISEDLVNQKIALVGMLTTLRRLITKKKNQTMLVATVEDLEGAIEMVAFPDCYERNSEVWQEDAIVRIDGKVDQRNDTLQIICESITLLQSDDEAGQPVEALPSNTPLTNGAKTPAISSRGPTSPRYHLHISLVASDDFDADVKQMQALDRILRQHTGQSRVTLHVLEGPNVVSLEPLFQRIDFCEELEDEILQLLGEKALRVEELDPSEESKGYLTNGLHAS